MLFNNFELEDLYNKYELDSHYSISTACLSPLSINDLFSLANIADFKNNIDGGSSFSEDNCGLYHDFINLKVDYAAKFGSEFLIDALESSYSKDLLYLSTSGASEAIVLVFSSLFSRGDKIIVQKPIYPSLYKVAEGLGVEIIDWDFDWGNKFEFNYQELESIVKQNKDIKAIVINNPNNPTGYCFNSQELNQLVNLASSKDIYLIADEVFKDLVDPKLSIPSVAKLYSKAICIADVSKAYGLQGLRTGWIACQDSDLREKFLAMKNYFSLRTPILGEYLAAIALNNSEKLLGSSRKKISEAKKLLFHGLNNKKYQDLSHKDSRKKLILDRIKSFQSENNKFINELESILGAIELDLKIQPEKLQGLSCFAEINSEKYSAEDIFQFLIKNKIFMLPGHVYGSKYSQYLRLGLLSLA
ncbi:MAG: pyridoxal phosphate-dependent aminotransferase [Candidatus Caenarcaniphilales bacterium]|nr:pyridoxal phosphate-dependent aminotransferase [Candidatus Caenarcaniphilales bacterium]